MEKALRLAIILVMGFSLSACTAKNVASENGNEASGNDAAQGQRRPEGDRRMPDFGQPAEDADARGLISSVVGNEVRFLKIERPQRTEAASGEQDNEAASASRTQGSQTRTGGFMPGAGPGMGMGMRGSNQTNSEEQKKAMLERMKEMSSGEETVTIPVGIRMLKRDTEASGEEGPKMIEASLADIKADSMITVWYDKNVSDKKVASFVMIMN